MVPIASAHTALLIIDERLITPLSTRCSYSKFRNSTKRSISSNLQSEQRHKLLELPAMRCSGRRLECSFSEGEERASQPRTFHCANSRTNDRGKEGLFRDQQILSERPLLVHPLAFASEPRPLPHLRCFTNPVFVRALRPDRFIFIQRHAKPRCGYLNALPACRT